MGECVTDYRALHIDKITDICWCVYVSLVSYAFVYLALSDFEHDTWESLYYCAEVSQIMTQKHTTVVSCYCDVWFIEMLLIMIPDQYPNHYQAVEIYTRYFDSLDILMVFFLSPQYHNNEKLLYLPHLATLF